MPCCELFEDGGVEERRFLERDVMSGLVEPHEALDRCAQTREASRANRRVEMAIVPPEKEHDRNVQAGHG